MNLRKRRKFSLSKQKKIKRKTKQEAKEWPREPSDHSISKIDKFDYSERNSNEAEYPFVNIRTPEDTARYLESQSPDIQKGSGPNGESLIETLTEDCQSNMISNLSKLTKKNVLNRLSQSKEICFEEKNKGGVRASRETRVRKFGENKRVRTSR